MDGRTERRAVTMRARNIKPGFFSNDLLPECEPLARLLFIGLWCMADKLPFNYSDSVPNCTSMRTPRASMTLHICSNIGELMLCSCNDLFKACASATVF